MNPGKPNQHACIVAVLLLLVFSDPAVTQVVSEAPVEDPQPLIEVNEGASVDPRIQARLESIYNKIGGLEKVTVKVNSGVVTLTGDVANEALARDALDIAIRTAGVVTVTDEVNRTLDVGGNVRPLLEDFQNAFQSFVRAVPLIVLALAVFLLFIFLASTIAGWSSLWRKIAPNPFLSELLSQAVRIGIIVAGAVLALNLLGASRFVTTILGGAGVLGIAIGFAVRDSLENYISSIMLSLRQPFRAQDHVLINEHEGIVVRLTSRATILMTLDGNHLRIPNSIVFKGIILNYTTNPERRFDFLLGVDADDDPLAAMQVALEAIDQHDSVLDDPKAGALIDSVGDSSIILQLTGWVDQSQSNFKKVRSLAIKSAKTALEHEGFTLPEPIYRLRFDTTPFEFTATTATEDDALSTSESAESSIEKFSPEPVIDVSVDMHLQEKVNKERARDPETDLLDQSQPTE